VSYNSENVKAWRRRTKKKLIKIFDDRCYVCKRRFNPVAYDFHHVDPKTKQYTISAIMSSIKSLDTIMAEAKKCIMVCASCHRQIHTGQIPIGCRMPFEKAIMVTMAAWKTQKKKDYGNCPICNSKLRGQKKYCSLKCSAKGRRKTTRPPENELKALVKENGYEGTGRILGVSGRSIRNWLEFYAGVA